MYDALAEPSSEPRLNRPPPAPPVSQQQDSPRRANSLPKRPTSSPPPRLRSLGLPGYARGQARPATANSNHDLVAADEGGKTQSTSFRHVLLAAKTHVFAITARDGNRQYAYCRPLSASHALVVLSNVSHTAVYVSALEHTAARYALLVDEGRSPTGLPAEQEQVPRSFLTAQLMRCPPEVAKVLVRSLADWLRADAGVGGQAKRSYGLLKRTRSRFLRENPALDADGEDAATDGDPNATWLTSSTTSSGLSSGPKGGLSRSRSAANVPETSSQEKESGRLFSRKDSGSGSGNGSGNVAKSALPWEAAAEGAESDGAAVVTRVLELTDATLLFQHFPVRGILSVIVALLEERRVCIVGPSTAVVSRAVIAFDNLVRPFEWPHLLSPILLEHMLPVLGAPFPFLVGIHADHMHMTSELPLDEVIFADLGTGKVTSTQDDTGDLYRHVPRKLRNRFERRLSRAKNACMRQVSRSLSSPFVPTVSNTAISYFQDSPFDSSIDKLRSSGLWRSKSQLRLYNEANPQNIWLGHETVVTLDRSMRKFFAEVLEDLPSIRGKDCSDARPGVENVSKISTSTGSSVSFATGRREADRRQFAKTFCETQMFMHWEGLDTADATFGIVASEPPQKKKRATAREKRSLAKKASVVGEELDDDDTLDMHVVSDLECLEDITEDFVLDIGEVSTRKRFRNKRKSHRANRTRLQFNSDVEEFGTDASDMQSGVEADFLLKKDTLRTVKLHRRNASTNCVPDVEPNFLVKKDTLRKVKVHRRYASTDCVPDVEPNFFLKEDFLRNVKPRRRNASTDFVPDVQPKFLLKEDILPIVKPRRRNASTDCILDMEPKFLLKEDIFPITKHRRRNASTDCIPDVERKVMLKEDVLPTVKPRRRMDTTECLPDSESDNVSKRPWLTLRLPSNRWTGRDVSAFVSPRDDAYATDEASDRLDADYTEGEDSDVSDNGGTETESHVFPSDDAVFSTSRVRAWGRRRVRHSAGIY